MGQATAGIGPSSGSYTAYNYGDGASNYAFATFSEISIGSVWPSLISNGAAWLAPLHVPVGATINSATLSYQLTPVGGDNLQQVIVNIYAHNVVDFGYPIAAGSGQAGAFTTYINGHHTSHSTNTTIAIPPNYSTIFTVDVKTLVQDLIALGTWYDGAYPGFFFKPTDGGATAAVKGMTGFSLTVDFTGTVVGDTSSGAVLGGSATVTSTYRQVASGGTILGGSILGGYTMRSTGGTILGGSAILGYTMSSTGGFVADGTGRMTMSSSNVATGGTILGGVSTFTYNTTATGGTLIGGSAIFNAGVPSISGATIGGSATLTNTYRLTATGGLVLGGLNQGMMYPTVISLTAWILPTDVSATGTARGIITKENDIVSPPIEWAFEQDPDVPTELRFRISRTTISGTIYNSWSTVNCGLTNTDWAFVVVTYDALTPPIFYKNGVMLTSL